jgi:hypothetical protein
LVSMSGYGTTLTFRNVRYSVAVGAKRTLSKPHPRCSTSTRLSWDFFCPQAAFKIAQLFSLDATKLIRHIEHLKELPDFYIFYCARCRHVETVKQERAA